MPIQRFHMPNIVCTGVLRLHCNYRASKNRITASYGIKYKMITIIIWMLLMCNKRLFGISSDRVYYFLLMI